MVHTRRLTLAAVIVLSLLLAVLSGCGKKDTANNSEDKAIPVTVNAAEKGSISSQTVVTGKVTPLEEVMLMPKIQSPMKAASVPVDVGARVKKGSLLVKLDKTDLEISLSQAINGLQNSKLTHNQAVLNYNNRKSDYERMQSLYNEGAVSKQQLEQAELAYNLARDSMNQPIIATSQDQVASIQNQIANATITSPIDGEVAVRNIDPGELASPSQPVMTVVNIDRVYIEGTVAESDISLVKKGQEVTVKVDAAGSTFTGVVSTLSSVANPVTKGYPIKVEIDNNDHKLKPGMFAEIQLVTRSKDDTIIIPKEALVTRGSDKTLYVVKSDIVEERKVQTGIEAESKIEIVKGLSEGEKFVIQGQQSLFDKAKVTVKS